MILHTTEVKYTGDYQLWLAFNNGESGPVDLKDELWGEMFEPLKNKVQFATAHQHPVMKTVAWANGADLAPEFLLDLLHEQSQQAA
ncbi:MAG: DUF2442 domain-containing protein [Methylococcales bacterium]